MDNTLVTTVYDFDELKELIQKSDKDYDLPRIEKAYQLAYEMHLPQKRCSGEPYIIHPLSVAAVLVRLGMDTDTIMAALLHDVVEDTPCTDEDLEKQFGSKIARLVDGVTKLGKFPYVSKEEQQGVDLQKMMLATVEDIRVIIIKFADRMHNMSTLEYVSVERQLEKAKECLDVYAPLADGMGIRPVQEYMRDLSLKYLDHVAYEEIEGKLQELSETHKGFIEGKIDEITQRVSRTIHNPQVVGRVKSIYSIHQKMFVQGKSFSEIYDLFAIRVIVDTIEDCYGALGIIHDMYPMLPDRFKDFISRQKSNTYRSLHTTLMSKEGIPFEVQIRTREMHRMAEYGIAAHWKYKLSDSDRELVDEKINQQLAQIRKMLEDQEEIGDVTDLVDNIKTDFGRSTVSAFTPKGKMIDLPAGATTVDFAYAIHSGLGNRMVGAKVHGQIVPVEYKIKTGDVVEITTVKDGLKGPNRDWLSIVRTSEAKNKIRTWFKRERRDENIIVGKAKLERAFRSYGIQSSPELMSFMVEEIGKRYNCRSNDDFYAVIGYGGIQLDRVMPRVRETSVRLSKSEEELLKLQFPEPKDFQEKSAEGVIVAGLSDCKTKLSKCCNPLPGDEIIGFVTRGYGVSIHKRSCSNVPRDIRLSEEPDRWKNAHWASNEIRSQYPAKLFIVASDRQGLLHDITTVINNMKLNVLHLNVHSDAKTKEARFDLTVKVRGNPQVQMAIERIGKIKDIISVDRS